MFAFKHIFVNM